MFSGYCLMAGLFKMNVTLSPANDDTLPKIKVLYTKSFPMNERKPFSMILKNREKGITDIFAAIDDNGNFCGLAIFVFYKDIVLLDYFAVCEELRGSGIGTVLLRKIQEHFSDKRLMLEIELADDEPFGDKFRRKKFYLRGGMSEAGLFVRLFGVKMEILSYRCEVSFGEYLELYRMLAGRCADKFVCRFDVLE